MRNKVTIVGAGNVGAATAQLIVQSGLADVVLVDIVEGLAEGKALDLAEAGPIAGYDTHISGSTGYEETASSDVVVITSGLARLPGMSRDDLLARNVVIVRSVVEQVAPRSPDAILVVVANPLDAMCHVALATSGFPVGRIVGMAGILDSARLRTFLAMELGVSGSSTNALVLGGHGDSMVPLARYVTVGGVPASELISSERLDRLVARTRNGGAEIVALLKTGSAYYAPAAAVHRMVDAILNDRHEILPCSAFLQGQYGIHGLFVGVLVRLGRGGVEQIFEIELTPIESTALAASAAAVRELVDKLAPEPALT
jgi:malate dehydrogenase